MQAPQEQFIEYHREALAPVEPIFVFDRFIPKHIPPRFKTHRINDTLFHAGKCRDFGAEGIDDDILFLDGDKFPSQSPWETIERLKHEGNDIILFATEEKDLRFNWITKYERPPFGCYGNPHNGFCSCGFWISKEAIAKLRQLNGGYIFNTMFDGRYGEEDRYLGDQATAAGFKAIGGGPDVLLYGSIGGIHDHKEDFQKNFIKRIFAKQELLGEHINDNVEWGKAII